MKRTMLLFMLTMLCLAAFCQARLHTSAAEIREEFSESRYDLKSGYDNDGDFYIRIFTERATVFYYFNSKSICYMTIIKPDDQGALNYYAELYNKQYVVISPTKWRMYSEGGIADIELVYPEDGGFYFVWTSARRSY
jgi:hypothetical protein